MLKTKIIYKRKMHEYRRSTKILTMSHNTLVLILFNFSAIFCAVISDVAFIAVALIVWSLFRESAKLWW